MHNYFVLEDLLSMFKFTFFSQKYLEADIIECSMSNEGN